jgi:NH3-dependent NAD+ synthetase
MVKLHNKKMGKVKGVVTAELIEERSATTDGKLLGFKESELKVLFRGVKNEENRHQMIRAIKEHCMETGESISQVVKRINEKRKELR